MSQTTAVTDTAIEISPELVKQTLMDWKKRRLASTPLVRYLMTRRWLAEHQDDAAAALEHVIQESIKRLNRTEASTINHLFQEGKPAHIVAENTGASESSIYRYRGSALRRLAEEWTRLETVAYRQMRGRIEARTPALPDGLFGVRDVLDNIIQALVAPDKDWVIGIEGIGGIGKTSLALAAALHHDTLCRFDSVVWVEARQTRFHPVHGLVKAPQPALPYEELVGRALEPLLDPHTLPEDHPRLQALHLQGLFKQKPILLVVDNLETAADLEALRPLFKLTNPSKVLITSRHSLHEFGPIGIFDLDDLSPADTIELLRHKLRTRNLSTLVNMPKSDLAAVYQVTGGNPLAIELVVGQLGLFSLHHVLADLLQARGDKVDEFYRFIYWNAWNQLDEDARQVLCSMPLVAENGGLLDQIHTVNGLDTSRLKAALEQLIRLSLVRVRHQIDETGTPLPDQARYNIHRLTESFLLEEVIQWQTTAAQA